VTTTAAVDSRTTEVDALITSESEAFVRRQPRSTAIQWMFRSAPSTRLSIKRTIRLISSCWLFTG